MEPEGALDLSDCVERAVLPRHALTGRDAVRVPALGLEVAVTVTVLEPDEPPRIVGGRLERDQHPRAALETGIEAEREERSGRLARGLDDKALGEFVVLRRAGTGERRGPGGERQPTGAPDHRPRPRPMRFPCDS